MEATALKAVSIQLTDGVAAIFVANGEEWNGLREWRCVAPRGLIGQKIVTLPLDESSSPLSSMFDEVFGRTEEFRVVMASPGIGVAIREAANLEIDGMNGTQAESA